jgi:hypothetical protein
MRKAGIIRFSRFDELPDLNKLGAVGARFHGGAGGRLIRHFQAFQFSAFQLLPQGVGQMAGQGRNFLDFFDWIGDR